MNHNCQLVSTSTFRNLLSVDPDKMFVETASLQTYFLHCLLHK
jgi:hypothetical protein